MLGDLIFKRLAELSGLGEKSLHRMLGARGNPRLRSLSAILATIEAQMQMRSAVTVQ